MNFLGRLHVLDLAGSPYERGQQHGEALRDEIQRHHRLWLEAIAADLGEDAGAYLDHMVASTGFFATAERLVPDLIAELRGIAEGAALPFVRVFARALSDEEPWFRWEYARDRAISRKGCSAFGSNAGPDAALLIAQTMDVPTWWDGGQTLLRFEQPNGDRALVFTVAGKISLCGMTRNRLAIACNAVMQLDHDRQGLAEDFVVRSYLASGSAAAGDHFLRTAPHASGQNYVVAVGDGRAASLECAAGGVVEWRGGDADCVVIHTNHPLVNPRTGQYEALLDGLDESAKADRFGRSTIPRLEALERRIDRQQPVDVAMAKTLLACREGPVCRIGEADGRRDGFSFGSLVMELGDTPRLHVAPGPANRTAWQVFDA